MCLLPSEGFLVHSKMLAKCPFPGFVSIISQTPFPLSLEDTEHSFHILRWFLFDTFHSVSLWVLRGDSQIPPIPVLLNRKSRWLCLQIMLGARLCFSTEWVPLMLVCCGLHGNHRLFCGELELSWSHRVSIHSTYGRTCASLGNCGLSTLGVKLKQWVLCLAWVPRVWLVSIGWLPMAKWSVSQCRNKTASRRKAEFFRYVVSVVWGVGMSLSQSQAVFCIFRWHARWRKRCQLKKAYAQLTFTIH